MKKCDICGDERNKLTEVGPEYRADGIREICDDCASVIGMEISRIKIEAFRKSARKIAKYYGKFIKNKRKRKKTGLFQRIKNVITRLKGF